MRLRLRVTIDVICDTQQGWYVRIVSAVNEEHCFRRRNQWPHLSKLFEIEEAVSVASAANELRRMTLDRYTLHLETVVQVTNNLDKTLNFTWQTK